LNLPLLQIGDSALPIGGYSHSWGLEAAIGGLVRDAAGLEAWVRAWLRHALAPLEGVVVAAVCRSVQRSDWPAVRQANDLLWSAVAPPTLRQASRNLGEQLLALAAGWPWAAAGVTGLRDTPPGAGPLEWHHPCVFAALAAAAGAAPQEAVLVYLHQAALGAIGAGVRAIPIGHTHGQQVLVRLHADLRQLAADAPCDLDAAGASCPAYEVLCHAQSRLYTRLFRS
jgi:urease accessory protein